MKIAKLEMKLILALMFLSFNYELVNESGKYPDVLPEPNRNSPLGVSHFSLFHFDFIVFIPLNSPNLWGNLVI